MWILGLKGLNGNVTPSTCRKIFFFYFPFVSWGSNSYGARVAQ